tara:strand:+ start:117 stop:551 length:435 start_codon:yes stop_codon:yes gene_type:complete
LFKDDYGDFTKLRTFKFEIILDENKEMIINDTDMVLELYKYKELLDEFAEEEEYEYNENDVAVFEARQQYRYHLDEYYIKCDGLGFTPSDSINGYRNWIFEYEMDGLYEIIELNLIEYERLMKVIAEEQTYRDVCLGVSIALKR